MIKYSIYSLLRGFVVFVFISFLLMSCNNDKTIVKESKIEIIFNKIDFDGKVYLERIDPYKTIIEDSAIVEKAKKIVFPISSKQYKDIYIIRFGPDQAITLIVDSNSDIIVNIDSFPFISNYGIENSEESELVRRNNAIVNKHIDIFENAYDNYRSAPRDSSFANLRLKTDSILRQNYINLYNELKLSIEDNNESLASLLAIYTKFGDKNVFDDELDSNLFRSLAKSLFTKYPDNSHAIFFNNKVEEYSNNIRLKETREHRLDKGNIYPDISLMSLNNVLYNIHKTTANYTIVYLWKSKYKKFWEDNIELKKLYAKYSRKELEIIGISFEKDKLSWSNYCTMEHMNWINLIASPEMENEINPSGIYPRVFLLDKQHKILVKDATIDEIRIILSGN